MSPALSHLTKVAAFLGLFLLMERLLDQTGLRSSTLNSLVDSISIDTGIRTAYIDFLVVGIAAGAMLWILTIVYRALYSMIRP